MPSAPGLEPSSRIIFAAGPFTAAPPTIGETAITGNARRAIHAPMSATPSIGATLTYGFEGQITAARTVPERSTRCSGAGARAAADAGEAEAAHARPALPPHEVVLEG